MERFVGRTHRAYALEAKTLALEAVPLLLDKERRFKRIVDLVQNRLSDVSQKVSALKHHGREIEAYFTNDADGFIQSRRSAWFFHKDFGLDAKDDTQREMAAESCVAALDHISPEPQQSAYAGDYFRSGLRGRVRPSGRVVVTLTEAFDV